MKCKRVISSHPFSRASRLPAAFRAVAATLAMLSAAAPVPSLAQVDPPPDGVEARSPQGGASGAAAGSGSAGAGASRAGDTGAPAAGADREDRGEAADAVDAPEPSGARGSSSGDEAASSGERSASTAPPPSSGGLRVAPDRRSLVIGPEAKPVPIPCPFRHAEQSGDRVWIICDDGTVHRVDLTSRSVVPVPVQGEAVGLFRGNGRVWVELLRREAMALGGPGGAAARAPAPPTMTPDPPRGVSPEAPPERKEPDEPTEEERPWRYRDLLAPRRSVGLELAVNGRVFLGEGAGVYGDASLVYRAEAPIFLRLRLEPVGAGFSDDLDRNLFGAAAIIGYDHRLFSVGVGIGANDVRLDNFDTVADGFALALVQSVRLGARDGLSVHVTNDFVWIDSEVFYSGTFASLQFPLVPDAWLLFRGGGGLTGHAYGEVALRMRVVDQGEGRGVYVIPGVGGAGITDDIAFNGFGGPSVSFGVEWRP